jgi:aminomethyltransferase
LIDENRCRVISDDLYETLRIEAGVPKYGIDMDDTTVVPELSLDGLISYNKGCYIGQEIIARIHFRGHVAKALSGVVSGSPLRPQTELQSLDGRPAGHLTSATYSPSLDRHIGLGYVRYEFLKPDVVVVAAGVEAAVHTLPFV